MRHSPASSSYYYLNTSFDQFDQASLETDIQIHFGVSAWTIPYSNRFSSFNF